MSNFAAFSKYCTSDSLGACWGCRVAVKCWIGPADCSGLVRILYIHPILRFEGECVAQCQGFLQGDSFIEGRNYLQVQLKMKFPVGRVGMSHCGSESRGGIFPPLQHGFTSSSALGSGVWHSCPCYWENKGIFRRCSTLDESPPWSEDLAMALPIHPVTPSTLLQGYVLYLYQCPLALAVFFLCLPYTASFCLHPARSPLGGEEDSGSYQLH